MRKYFVSLMATVFIVAMVVFAWAPNAKSGGPNIPADECLQYCQDQAICQCAKILGGSLRLTKCNIGAICEDVSSYGDFECVCDVDPLCAIWEKDKVVQSFPPEDPDCQLCGNGVVEGDEVCDGDPCSDSCGICINECSKCDTSSC